LSLDLEIIMSATRLFIRVFERILPVSEARNAYDVFHKVQAPML
jgi:hypothetical protein